jgi:hypothetical protein
MAAAIDRAQANRRELVSESLNAKPAGKISALLPKAAELHRRKIAAGLDGNAREAVEARVLLRENFGGKVPLE